jgi:hypothetical protein
MTYPAAVSDFWRLFEQKAGALARISSADDPLYDELLEQLQRIDEGLYIEFAAAPGHCVLVVTAEGDRELFDLAEAVVAAAPQVAGWDIVALKPKLGFPREVSWEGVRVDVAEVVFEPLSEEDSNDLGLRLLVPGLAEEDVEHVHNALLRVLDHALGERQFADSVQYTEVACLDEPAEDYIPLVELEAFIEWHRKRRTN